MTNKALQKALQDYVTIAEYAKMHDVPANTIKKRIQRNSYNTALKVGNAYILNKNETFTDSRNKNKENIKNN